MPTPAAHTFSLYQGQTWDDTIIIKEPDTTPTDLTGFLARMQLREEIESPIILLELTTENGRLAIPTPTGGQVVILVSAEDMAALPLQFETVMWLYELELYRPEVLAPDPPEPEYVKKVLRGYVVISPEVTR